MALMHSEDFVQLAQPSSAWREALTRAWCYIRGQYSESSEEDHCSIKRLLVRRAQMSSCFDLFSLSQLYASWVWCRGAITNSPSGGGEPTNNRKAPAKQLTSRNLKDGFQGFTMNPECTLAATNRVLAPRLRPSCMSWECHSMHRYIYR